MEFLEREKKSSLNFCISRASAVVTIPPESHVTPKRQVTLAITSEPRSHHRRTRTRTVRNNARRAGSPARERVCTPHTLTQTPRNETCGAPHPQELPPGPRSARRRGCPPAPATRGPPVRHWLGACPPCARTLSTEPAWVSLLRRCRDSQAKLCLFPREGAGGGAGLPPCCPCQQRIPLPSPAPGADPARPMSPPVSVTHPKQPPASKHARQSRGSAQAALGNPRP